MPTNSTINDLFNVNGIVAVITGGGTGLGLWIARALDANGAKAVYILGRTKSVLQEAARNAENGTLRPLVADATDKACLLQAAAKIEAEEGFINILFANSGIAGPDQVKNIKPNMSAKEFAEAMLSSDDNSFTQVMHVNTTGVFYTAMAFLPLLEKGNLRKNVTQDSQIIITTSMAAYTRLPGLGFAYNTSKAATTHLAKMLATTFAQQSFRIRVNCVAPGFFPTGTSKGSMEGMAEDERVEGAFEMGVCPAGRTGCEGDLAGTVLFLASRAGAYVNGGTVLIDGGLLGIIPSTI